MDSGIAKGFLMVNAENENDSVLIGEEEIWEAVLEKEGLSYPNFITHCKEEKMACRETEDFDRWGNIDIKEEPFPTEAFDGPVIVAGSVKSMSGGKELKEVRASRKDFAASEDSVAREVSSAAEVSEPAGISAAEGKLIAPKEVPVASEKIVTEKMGVNNHEENFCERRSLEVSPARKDKIVAENQVNDDATPGRVRADIESVAVDSLPKDPKSGMELVQTTASQEGSTTDEESKVAPSIVSSLDDTNSEEENQGVEISTDVQVNSNEDVIICSDTHSDKNPSRNPSRKVQKKATSRRSEPKDVSLSLKRDVATLRRSARIKRSLSHKSDRVFNCEKCSYSCDNLLDLLKHSETFDVEHLYTCGECSYSSNCIENFLRHTKTHSGSDTLKCHKCSFHTFDELTFIKHCKVHFSSHSSIGNFPGKNKPSVSIRIKKSEESSTDSFSSGNSESQNDFSLKSHEAEIELASAENEFEQGVSPSLNSTQRGSAPTHSCENPFKCDVCSYCAKDENDLSSHSETHSGVSTPKPGDHQSLSSPNVGDKNVEQHQNEALFKCKLCPFSTERMLFLIIHSQTHKYVKRHEDETSFRCKLCPFSTKRKVFLDIHSQTHSKENLSNSGKVYVQQSLKGCDGPVGKMDSAKSLNKGKEVEEVRSSGKEFTTAEVSAAETELVASKEIPVASEKIVTEIIGAINDHEERFCKRRSLEVSPAPRDKILTENQVNDDATPGRVRADIETVAADWLPKDSKSGTDQESGMEQVQTTAAQEGSTSDEGSKVAPSVVCSLDDTNSEEENHGAEGFDGSVRETDSDKSLNKGKELEEMDVSRKEFTTTEVSYAAKVSAHAEVLGTEELIALKQIPVASEKIGAIDDHESFCESRSLEVSPAPRDKILAQSQVNDDASPGRVRVDTETVAVDSLPKNPKSGMEQVQTTAAQEGSATDEGSEVAANTLDDKNSEVEKQGAEVIAKRQLPKSKVFEYYSALSDGNHYVCQCDSNKKEGLRCGTIIGSIYSQGEYVYRYITINMKRHLKRLHPEVYKIVAEEDDKNRKRQVSHHPTSRSSRHLPRKCRKETSLLHVEDDLNNEVVCLDKQTNRSPTEVQKNASINNEPAKCQTIERAVDSLPHAKSRSDSDAAIYKCSKCPFYTNKLWACQEHILTHSWENIVKCPKCSYVGMKKDLVTHLATHNTLKCSECSFRTTIRVELEKHILVHKISKFLNCKKSHYYQCGNCSFIATSVQSYQKHKKSHSGSTLLKCDLCPYNTYSVYQFDFHLKSHEAEIDLILSENKFERGTSPSLNFTQRGTAQTHSRENPFKCDVCSYCAKDENDLSSHSETHSGVSTPKAGNPPSLSSNVGDKNVEQHQNEASFRCKLCPFSTERMFFLDIHSQTHLVENLLNEWSSHREQNPETSDGRSAKSPCQGRELLKLSASEGEFAAGEVESSSKDSTGVCVARGELGDSQSMVDTGQLVSKSAEMCFTGKNVKDVLKYVLSKIDLSKGKTANTSHKNVSENQAENFTNSSEGFATDVPVTDISEGLVTGKEDIDSSKVFFSGKEVIDSAEGFVTGKKIVDSVEGFVAEEGIVDPTDGIVIGNKVADSSEGFVSGKEVTDPTEGFVPGTEVTDSVERFVSGKEVTDSVKGFVSGKEVTDSVEGFVTGKEVTDSVEGFVSGKEVTDSVEGFGTGKEVTDTGEACVSGKEVTDSVEGFIPGTKVTDSVEGFVSGKEVTDSVEGFGTGKEVTDTGEACVSGKEVTDSVEGFIPGTEVTDSVEGFVSGKEVTDSVEGFVSGREVTNSVEGFGIGKEVTNTGEGCVSAEEITSLEEFVTGKELSASMVEAIINIEVNRAVEKFSREQPEDLTGNFTTEKQRPSNVYQNFCSRKLMEMDLNTKDLVVAKEHLKTDASQEDLKKRKNQLSVYGSPEDLGSKRRRLRSASRKEQLKVDNCPDVGKKHDPRDIESSPEIVGARIESIVNSCISEDSSSLMTSKEKSESLDFPAEFGSRSGILVPQTAASEEHLENEGVEVSPVAVATLDDANSEKEDQTFESVSSKNLPGTKNAMICGGRNPNSSPKGKQNATEAKDAFVDFASIDGSCERSSDLRLPRNELPCDGELHKFDTSESNVGSEVFPCHEVNSELPYAAKIKKSNQHADSYSKKRVFKRGKCESSTKKNINLSRNLMNHGNRMSIRCKNCSYVAKSSYAYQLHMKLHFRKRLNCSHCNYSTRKEADLRKHMMTHDAFNPFKCSECSYAGRTKDAIQLHLKIHANKVKGKMPMPIFYAGTEQEQLNFPSVLRRFKCNLCPYETKKNSNLKRHKNSHSKGTLVKCKEKKETSAKGNADFKSHQAIPAVEAGDFKCTVCTFSTISKLELSAHAETHSLFSCKECSFSTFEKDKFEGHSKIHRGIMSLNDKSCSNMTDQKLKLINQSFSHSGEEISDLDCESNQGHHFEHVERQLKEMSNASHKFSHLDKQERDPDTSLPLEAHSDMMEQCSSDKFLTSASEYHHLSDLQSQSDKGLHPENSVSSIPEESFLKDTRNIPSNENKSSLITPGSLLFNSKPHTQRTSSAESSLPLETRKVHKQLKKRRSEEKLFKCDVCSYSTDRKMFLLVHARSHLVENLLKEESLIQLRSKNSDVSSAKVTSCHKDLGTAIETQNDEALVTKKDKLKVRNYESERNLMEVDGHKGFERGKLSEEVDCMEGVCDSGNEGEKPKIFSVVHGTHIKPLKISELDSSAIKKEPWMDQSSQEDFVSQKDRMDIKTLPEDLCPIKSETTTDYFLEYYSNEDIPLQDNVSANLSSRKEQLNTETSPKDGVRVNTPLKSQDTDSLELGSKRHWNEAFPGDFVTPKKEKHNISSPRFEGFAPGCKHAETNSPKSLGKRTKMVEEMDLLKVQNSKWPIVLVHKLNMTEELRKFGTLTLTGNDLGRKEASPSRLRGEDESVVNDIRAKPQMEIREVDDSGVATYYCSRCLYATNGRLDLNNHIRAHRNDPFTCEDCSYSTKTEEEFRRHLDSHSGEELCEGECSNGKVCDLEGQSVPRSDVKVYQCPECAYSSHSKNSVRSHRKIHAPYKCDKCSFRTSEKKVLSSHLYIHPATNSYACSDCSFTTYSSGLLKEHVFNRHIHKSLKCDRCLYSTDKRSELIVHTSSHCRKRSDEELGTVENSVLDDAIVREMGLTNEPSYQCKVCTFKTSVRYFYDFHLKLHSMKKDKRGETSQPFRKECDADIRPSVNPGEKVYSDHSLRSSDSQNDSRPHSKKNSMETTRSSVPESGALRRATPNSQLTGNKPNFTILNQLLSSQPSSEASSRESSLPLETRKVHKQLKKRRSEEKLFKCDVCSYSTDRKMFLLVHARSHLVENLLKEESQLAQQRAKKNTGPSAIEKTFSEDSVMRMKPHNESLTTCLNLEKERVENGGLLEDFSGARKSSGVHNLSSVDKGKDEPKIDGSRNSFAKEKSVEIAGAGKSLNTDRSHDLVKPGNMEIGGSQEDLPKEGCMGVDNYQDNFDAGRVQMKIAEDLSLKIQIEDSQENTASGKEGKGKPFPVNYKTGKELEKIINPNDLVTGKKLQEIPCPDNLSTEKELEKNLSHENEYVTLHQTNCNSVPENLFTPKVQFKTSDYEGFKRLWTPPAATSIINFSSEERFRNDSSSPEQAGLSEPGERQVMVDKKTTEGDSLPDAQVKNSKRPSVLAQLLSMNQNLKKFETKTLPLTDNDSDREDRNSLRGVSDAPLLFNPGNSHPEKTAQKQKCSLSTINKSKVQSVDGQESDGASFNLREGSHPSSARQYLNKHQETRFVDPSSSRELSYTTREKEPFQKRVQFHSANRPHEVLTTVKESSLDVMRANKMKTINDLLYRCKLCSFKTSVKYTFDFHYRLHFLKGDKRGETSQPFRKECDADIRPSVNPGEKVYSNHSLRSSDSQNDSRPQSKENSMETTRSSVPESGALRQTTLKSCLTDHPNTSTPSYLPSSSQLNLENKSSRTESERPVKRQRTSREKAFQCEVCSYSTDRKMFLMIHSRTHLVESFLKEESQLVRKS